MSKHTLALTIRYALASGAAIIIGFFLWEYFTSRTYQVVTLFIVLIIISNCFAQLYLIYLNL